MIAFAKSLLPNWPDWALDALLVMTALLLAVATFSAVVSVPGAQNDTSPASSSKEADKSQLYQKFTIFRRKYIAVYMVIMLADWM